MSYFREFDMFEDFNSNEYDQDDEIFNLKLTYRKRSTEKKVASMDKILDDIRRVKYDTKQILASDFSTSDKKPNKEDIKDNQFSIINKSKIEESTEVRNMHNINLYLNDNKELSEHCHDNSIHKIVQNLMFDLLNAHFSY